MSIRYLPVLITGSEGFIGSCVKERLEKEGANIITVDIKGSPDIKVNVASDEFCRLLSPYSFSYILHFGSACSVIQYNEQPVYHTYNALHGTKNIIKLAKQSGAKIIFPSSGNVYGGNSTVQKETDVPIPTNMYATSKLISEDMFNLARNFGIESMVFRIFAGYGIEEKNKGNLQSAVSMFYNDIKNNIRPVIWGDGEQTRDFVHISDIVETIARSMKLNLSGTMNIGTGVSTSFNNIIDIINSKLGKDIEPMYVPKPKFYVERTMADITKLRETTGIEPISLDKGIELMIEADS